MPVEFKGSLVALVTPFREGKVDYVALEKLVNMQIEAGTDGLVPVGTTGESPTLSKEEKHSVIRSVIEAAAGRVPVVAGTGTNNTATTVEMTKFAAEAGAAGVLVVTPYYNKPTQEGFFRHYKAAAEAADVPVIAYNIPGRSAAGMTVDTIYRIAEIENVVALKDATGSVNMAMDVLSDCDITILSGDDALTLPFMAVGGKGVISVAANIVPGEIVKLTHSALEGDFKTALEVQRRLHPLCRVLFAETNPLGIKAALALAGRIDGGLRLPLVPMSDSNLQTLRVVMSNMGLL